LIDGGRLLAQTCRTRSFQEVKNMTESRPSIRGVLHLWSETGTEGGYWALQDQRFITPNTTRFSCQTCGAYWDKAERPSGPVADEHVGDRHGTNSFGLPFCPPGTHDFRLICPEDWSYEGLHVLKDGDELTVYSKDDPSVTVWSGTIRLKQHPLFTEDASGFWLHADQEGVSREQWAEWFFQGHPATLRPAPEPKS